MEDLTQVIDVSASAIGVDISDLGRVKVSPRPT